MLKIPNYICCLILRKMKKANKKPLKKYQNGGMTNAEKVAANKKKVEANAKKVQANREKVILGKMSPNSEAYGLKGGKGSNTSMIAFSNEKGDLQGKSKTTYKTDGSKKLSSTSYYSYTKPRVVKGEGKIGESRKVTSAQSMDTTGYAAGKQTFVMNTKKAVPGGGNMYKQSSKKVDRKDVPKELKKMQTFRKGGKVGAKKGKKK